MAFVKCACQVVNSSSVRAHRPMIYEDHDGAVDVWSKLGVDIISTFEKPIVRSLWKYEAGARETDRSYLGESTLFMQDRVVVTL